MNPTYRLPEEFSTDRFLIRRILPSDADAIFAGWATDLEVTKYLTWRPHTELSQTREAAERSHRDWEGGATFPAVICSRDAPSELIGRIDARLFGPRVSYGWLVRKDRWGQGVASEVVHWAVKHALSHPMIYRTEAACDVMNVASARVMEKAGMTQEALLRRYLFHPNVSDEPRDAFLYSKVR
ncbi:RimJ/RimL family protein N-acetyltransferase [Rhizobium sp. BK313]|jgi:RimJ/RimL family protein N-acetyltransferase|uniref:GNAT family N-acetyltransferase n=1 Tax=Rhizobium sp. BK313 TaxID=2587081 RepID=UPI00105FF2BE|nr:GNAT family protein [Rhizobium sp. BK313]MBB3454270.1 RimJ/RimL family protein N-acetyltransferase [Rhizobium sp. BK313]